MDEHTNPYGPALNALKFIKDHASKSFVGTDVILLSGKYKGRRGRIHAVMIDHQIELKFLVHPYRNDTGGKRTEFLADHPDARTYWEFEELKFLDLHK